MLCTQCGHKNEEGAVVCTACGAPLKNMAEPVRAAVPRRRRRRLIIVLSMGGAVLAIAATVLMIWLMSGTSVSGQWYSAKSGEVLAFGQSGELVIYSLAGSKDAGFEYNMTSGEGTISLNGETQNFYVDEGQLIWDTADGKLVFDRAVDLDVESVVMGPLAGQWCNEALAEVLVLDGKGAVSWFTMDGEQQGSFSYDIDRGKGIMILGGSRYTFNANVYSLDIQDKGAYAKETESLDINSYIATHAIIGMWYDQAGVNGTVSFFDDGSVETVSYGQTVEGRYVNNMDGTGAVSVNSQTQPWTLKKGVLEMNGVRYGRKTVEQYGQDDVYNAIAGLWYEQTGEMGTVEFAQDGTVKVVNYNGEFGGTATYDPVNKVGEININLYGNAEPVDFHLDGNTLFINETAFTRDAVEPVVMILGQWFDTADSMSTLSFMQDGTFELIAKGVAATGTYVYDKSTRTGTLTMPGDDGPVVTSVIIQDGKLQLGDHVYARSAG